MSGLCGFVSGINESDIEGIQLKDKSANPLFQDELVQLGGKSQVPCLFIDGKPLYESGDIIDWLQNNVVNA